jgi:hypothetical protein
MLPAIAQLLLGVGAGGLSGLVNGKPNLNQLYQGFLAQNEAYFRPAAQGLSQAYQGQAAQMAQSLSANFGRTGAFGTGAGQAAGAVGQSYLGTSTARSEFELRKMVTQLASGLTGAASQSPYAYQPGVFNRIAGGVAGVMASPDFGDILSRVFSPKPVTPAKEG